MPPDWFSTAPPAPLALTSGLAHGPASMPRSTGHAQLPQVCEQEQQQQDHGGGHESARKAVDKLGRPTSESISDIEPARAESHWSRQASLLHSDTSYCSCITGTGNNSQTDNLSTHSRHAHGSDVADADAASLPSPSPSRAHVSPCRPGPTRHHRRDHMSIVQQLNVLLHRLNSDASNSFCDFASTCAADRRNRSHMIAGARSCCCFCYCFCFCFCSSVLPAPSRIFNISSTSALCSAISLSSEDGPSLGSPGYPHRLYSLLPYPFPSQVAANLGRGGATATGLGGERVDMTLLALNVSLDA